MLTYSTLLIVQCSKVNFDAVVLDLPGSLSAVLVLINVHGHFIT